MQRGLGILQHSFTMGRRSVGKEHLPSVTDITATDFHCGGQGGSLSLSLSHTHTHTHTYTHTLFYILQPWANFSRRYLEFLKRVLRMGIKAKSKAHEAN